MLTTAIQDEVVSIPDTLNETLSAFFSKPIENGNSDFDLKGLIGLRKAQESGFKFSKLLPNINGKFYTRVTDPAGRVKVAYLSNGSTTTLQKLHNVTDLNGTQMSDSLVEFGVYVSKTTGEPVMFIINKNSVTDNNDGVCD